MARHRRHRLAPTLIAWLFAGLSTANLPYIPTQLLGTSQNDVPLVYILDPPASSPPLGRLRALSPTSSFTAAQPSSYTLSDSLPFASSNTSYTYTTSLDSNGNIVVVAGDCSLGASASVVWKFSPIQRDSKGNGTWTKQSISTSGLSGSASSLGTNFLASSISFTPTTKANSSMLTFGGMCPFANSTAASWTSDATYSNQLLVLDVDSVTQYDFTLGTSNGQPIAEAGFSTTPLAPTFSNSSDGSGTQVEQQDFLLLGGHTGDAFINMSQVAVFSMPQTSWTFLPVNQYDGKTDLKARDTGTLVEPRSGHTALLSSDGTKVIMYGGWVGDISTPADPQLAILDIGVGYGGSGSWSWAQPPAQPVLSSGLGLYGHGATMLPGNVMMITGGYSISSGNAGRAKRDAEPVSEQTLLYNISSDTWITSYDSGLVVFPGSSSGSSTGPLSTEAQKVGLGVGLTLGLLALALAGLACWLLAQHLSKEDDAHDSEMREKEINDLDAAASLRDRHNMLGLSHLDEQTGYQSTSRLWDGRQISASHSDTGPNVWRNDSLREAERTGLDIDVPSPQRGLRKSLGGRNMHSASKYDDGRMARTASGTIHPIEEKDEEEVIEQMRPREDPFRDPSPPPVPVGQHRIARKAISRSADNRPAPPPEERALEQSAWVQHWAKAAANRARSPEFETLDAEEEPQDKAGVSPEKSERTRSDLSEHSTRSERSTESSSYSGRTTNARTAKVARGGLRIMPAAYNPFASSPASSPTRSTHLLTPGAASTGADADSFTTAQTTFVPLQSEADELLGPARPGQARYPIFTHDSHVFPDSLEPDEGPTFTVTRGHRAPSSKMGSWVGSVRRVINAGRSSSMTSTNAPRVERDGGLGGLMVYETRGSAASSPTKKGGVSRLAAEARHSDGGAGFKLTPRRSASDGAAFFLGGKRAAEDEDDERRTSSMADSRPPGWKDTRDNDDDDDWNQERAFDNRNVQVMYSVPKERLRVVNAELEASSSNEAMDVMGRRRS